MNSSRHKHRSQRRVWKTRAQEERENREMDARHERQREAEDARIHAAMQAQWDARPPEEQAEEKAQDARLSAARWADHLDQLAQREKRDRERHENMTYGT
jgi:hypothetical protein